MINGEAQNELGNAHRLQRPCDDDVVVDISLGKEQVKSDAKTPGSGEPSPEGSSWECSTQHSSSRFTFHSMKVIGINESQEGLNETDMSDHHPGENLDASALRQEEAENKDQQHLGGDTVVPKQQLFTSKVSMQTHVSEHEVQSEAWQSWVRISAVSSPSRKPSVSQVAHVMARHVKAIVRLQRWYKHSLWRRTVLPEKLWKMCVLLWSCRLIQAVWRDFLIRKRSRISQQADLGESAHKPAFELGIHVEKKQED